MKNLIVSAAVLQKLREKHNVSRREVEQCFENKCGLYLMDDREDHQSDPPTLWFISSTNRERLLKVIFIFIEGNVHLKSAYEPEPEAIALYDEIAR
ncbi:ADP-ribosyl-(dinitrogen reductase) hydrolase [Variovorax paradoxus]|uniref:ADP-ribosyl-(dinitrogen reductase) hydrolase n=1 Tax=Variovorax paradoxus TaxID=34073 RepID=UPI003D6599F4